MAPLRRSALSLGWLVCVLTAGCHRPVARAPTSASASGAATQAPIRPNSAPPLLAPRVQQSLALDGELSESAWREAGHSGGFTDEKTGRLAVPHSELRVAGDGERLLLGLYAADENIADMAKKGEAPDQEDDAFIVHIRRVGDGGSQDLTVSANGAVRDERPDGSRLGAACAVEMDGTMNNATDDDEEWVAECVVPFKTLGIHIGDMLELSVKRCDTPKGSARRCGVWQRRVLLQ